MGYSLWGRKELAVTEHSPSEVCYRLQPYLGLYLKTVLILSITVIQQERGLPLGLQIN